MLQCHTGQEALWTQRDQRWKPIPPLVGIVIEERVCGEPCTEEWAPNELEDIPHDFLSLIECVECTRSVRILAEGGHGLRDVVLVLVSVPLELGNVLDSETHGGW